jgi:hypothetical protein
VCARAIMGVGFLIGLAFVVAGIVVLAKNPPRTMTKVETHIELGPVRKALGRAILLFVPLGFTPAPFTFSM